MVQAPVSSRLLAPDPYVTDRFTTSLRTDPLDPADDTADLRRWLASRREANTYKVSRIPFADLDRWCLDAETGNLRHESGQFFTVEGLHVRTDYGVTPEWSQPIINQPEVGILGILVREIGGTMHCLMQAKMEPGNINLVQLSPTVQATRSNYRRVHRGAPIRYLEYFRESERGHVLVDVLQSEQGAWFHGKRNRNMVVEVFGDVPEHPDFRWVPVGQLCRLLHFDDLVNMDSRTVLACMPFGEPGPAPRSTPFLEALHRSFLATGSHLTTSELLSWFSEMKVRHDLTTRLIPLRDAHPWRTGPAEIAHADDRYFEVVAVNVEASNREVGHWTQPLLAPRGQGVVALLTKRLNGVLHLLMHARVEAGYRDVVELAPTVQSAPANYRHLPEEAQPRYLDYVQRVSRDRIRYDAVQSDEGGRLLHAQNRHVVIEVDDDFPIDTPPDYAWLTLHQLTNLMRHSYYLNIQARSLIACLYGLR